ncbi:MAG: hypothetical protein P8L85_08995 [Rubripirellula sp.]|nr:hypothetical protein [Rubripirellula sp.]
MDWPPLPDYGCIVRWPADGQGFIHPDDVPIATRCFPSERVFRRDLFDGVYYHYSYGPLRFRLRPTMWLKVEAEGIDVGDQVETTGLGMERELFVARIKGMYFVRQKGRILYRLTRSDNLVPGLFASHQLRLITDKTNLRPGDTEYPEPKSIGSGETLSNWESIDPPESG